MTHANERVVVTSNRLLGTREKRSQGYDYMQCLYYIMATGFHTLSHAAMRNSSNVTSY